jgi:hypothetical protein
MLLLFAETEHTRSSYGRYEGESLGFKARIVPQRRTVKI